MYNEKYLLFTSKKGDYKTTDNVYDPLTWTSTEAVLYPASTLLGMKPASATTIDMSFNNNGKTSTVTLDIKNGNHVAVMSVIGSAIATSNQSIITVADTLGHIFIHKDIYGATIKTQETYIQTLTGNSRTQLSVTNGYIKSCLITNIDGTDAVACTLELHDGSTYTKLLDQMSIPAKNTLKLEEDEISFDNVTYNLYATSGDAGGQLTFTFNH